VGAPVAITGDQAEFGKRYGVATESNVIKFLTFDAEYPNSILSCLRAARENARSVREIISSEMWLQLNRLYLMVNSAARDSGGLDQNEGFYDEVKQASHLFTGSTDATMTQGEAWHFSRLGRMLERADKTSRILDVKYFLLLPSAEEVGTPFDDIQWAAVLRSASAFEMYRQRHGRISRRGVVDFLMLDREFPRAIRFCLLAARDSLHAISGTPLGTFRYAPEKLLGQLGSDLSFAGVHEMIQRGLHEYLDELQNKLNQVGQGIFEAFFALKTPQPGKKTAQSAAQ
jgi:uncharacterized alpha-E superfamily protein